MPNSQGDPLINGPYGSVAGFVIQTEVEFATVTPDADSLGQLNGGDVIVTYPSANDPNQDQTRTVTLLFSLNSPGDTNSYPMRKSLFQNAICWLLQCGACAAVYPSYGFEVNPLVPRTGEPATLTLSLGNDGECDGVGYTAIVHLAEGLNFVSATSDYGRITSTNQVISLYGGRISARQHITLEITVVPQVPGWFTNQVDIESGSTIPQTHAAIFETQGDALPQWSIELSPPNAVLLRFTNAEPGRSYIVQRAILQPGTTIYRWITFTNFQFTPPEFRLREQIQGTNSGAIYQAIPQP
jgi:hypothetical protein